jgi:hypothetical protein
MNCIDVHGNQYISSFSDFNIGILRNKKVSRIRFFYWEVSGKTNVLLRHFAGTLKIHTPVFFESKTREIQQMAGQTLLAWSSAATAAGCRAQHH